MSVVLLPEASGRFAETLAGGTLRQGAGPDGAKDSATGRGSLSF